MSKKLVKTSNTKPKPQKNINPQDVIDIIKSLVEIAKDERQTKNYLKKVDEAKQMVREVAKTGHENAGKIIKFIKENKELMDNETVQELLKTASNVILKSTPSININLDQAINTGEHQLKNEEKKVIDADFEKVE